MMNRLTIFFLTLLLSAPMAAQTEADTLATDTAEVRLPYPLCIQMRLDSLTTHAELLQTSQLGLMVYDLTADSAIYRLNERQLMRPASTMKLVTAITALDLLGGNYRLRTELRQRGTIDADGTLHGDLICVGGMDPCFTTSDLNAFVQAIRTAGIDSISGRIIADTSMKEDVPYGEGWCWDDKNPILSPLTIGRDTAFVSRLRAALEPTPDPSRREGSLVSAKGPTPDPSQREGSLAAVKEPTPNPSRREGSLATIKAETNQAPLPSGGVGGGFTLATCTHTIDQLLRRMLKESDNFYAEALFYQTAASQGSRPAKASHARAATKRLISRIGLGGQPYRIADGSGLSLYNYVSAELETMLLRYAWQKPAIYSHLYPALPIAGVDGTLKKRMTGTAAGGNVHAKTGTLTGVISLAGYCTAANGHRLCFAIINQGVMTGSTARTFQDRLCRILCEP